MSDPIPNPIKTASTTAGKPTRSLWWIAGVLIALVLLGAFVFWRRKGTGQSTDKAGSPDSRPVPVMVDTVQNKDVQVFLEGLGAAIPLQTVTVRAQVDGRLDRVMFKEGQAVKKGEQIAQIDPRSFAIQLRQAEAAISKDTVQWKNAKVNLDRYQSLRDQNLIPQQQLDDQRALTEQLGAAINADKAISETARLLLDYARIISPIDGVTGVRLVDPGNIVRANDAAGIVVITQLDPMAVMFSLPEDDLPRVLDQQSKGITEVEAYNRDGSTKLAVGQLAVIDNQINQTTATIRLKAVFPNPAHLLWPNEFIRARLFLPTIKGATVVPAVAIQRGPQGSFVYVVSQDNTVASRPIEVSLVQGDSAIVGKGLSAGETVVIDGQNQLKPGAKVSPRSSDRKSAAAGSGSANPTGSTPRIGAVPSARPGATP